MTNAIRSFASKAEAEAFAKEVGSAAAPLDKWNPMRDFGYRWQVPYTAVLKKP
jgi:hypothetical protein